MVSETRIPDSLCYKIASKTETGYGGKYARIGTTGILETSSLEVCTDASQLDDS